MNVEVTGFRGKDFEAMTRDELLEACKVLSGRLAQVLYASIDPIEHVGASLRAGQWLPAGET